ncbi:MAG: hypothetical protein WBD31_22445 [Rubripirellula sp.]
MMKNAILGLSLVFAIGLGGIAHGAIVVSGEIVPITEGYTGEVGIGIFATSDVATTISSYNLPTLFSNPAVASYVSFEATNFGFGTESAPVLPANFTSDVGFAGGAGAVPVLAMERVKVGEIVFSISNAPLGLTEVGQFIDTGFDRNFFQFATSGGVQSGGNGGLTLGSPSLGIQVSAVPEPSVFALAAVSLTAVGMRRRRTKK